MTTAGLIAILPLLLLSCTAVGLMLIIAIHRSHRIALGLTLLGLAAAFGSLWISAEIVPQRLTSLLMIDQYALFYFGMIIAATIAVAGLAYGYLEEQAVEKEEFYILLLTAALGAAVLAASSHFVSFFLGLEVLSISLYALNAYIYPRKTALEAGIKYLVLAAASAAFLLFGMALIYAAVGTMEFGHMAELMMETAGPNRTLLLPGLAMIITGIAFKLALAPFHMWTPDVYQGAPPPVAAFIATVSKGGMFALLLRYFYRLELHNYQPVVVVFTIIAIASMLGGNLLALLQSNVKRILAYSSIAHMGYVLVAFIASGELAVQAVTFYLVAYFVTIIGAFGVVTVLSNSEEDAESLEAYRGLFWRRPALAGVMTAMLLSLTGIPVTAGFIGKFYVVAAGASSSAWALIIILVVSSVIGAFYYLRVIFALYAGAPEDRGAEAAPRMALGSSVLVVLTVLLIWLGVYPAPLLHVIRAAMPG
ncbi:MAG TPA: NADH-quinone oxidoreductase subunit N [Terriglobales bacterium]|jgi:NADH-quinone oxidoreductase subunit N|nr:NADH-quinone oxidoreductase subunit N [Terriglobales bacterium]